MKAGREGDSSVVLYYGSVEHRPVCFMVVIHHYRTRKERVRQWHLLWSL